jgi:hypothetical protein
MGLSPTGSVHTSYPQPFVEHKAFVVELNKTITHTPLNNSPPPRSICGFEAIQKPHLEPYAVIKE